MGDVGLDRDSGVNGDISAASIVRKIELVLGIREDGILKDGNSFLQNTYSEIDNQLVKLSILRTNINIIQFRQLMALLAQCHYLTGLTINSCRLNDIEAIRALKSIKDLDISNNCIFNIESIASLTNLRILHIDRNPIDKFRLEMLIKSLTLKKLVAWEIGLTDCEFLRGSKSLEQVYLSENFISDISPLKSLPKLRIADVSNNKIVTIPSWVADRNWVISIESPSFSHKINTILFEDNPITTPPIEIAQQGKAAIANYYQQLAGNDTVIDHLFEAKMLIVGEPGAGKTSLVRKIESSFASLPQDNETTKGIDVLRYNFPINRADFPNFKGETDIDGKNFRVNLWDFGGQEIYLATHRFFLSKRALYAVVSDSRKEDTDFNYWLHIVEMFGDNSPVVIILNEKDGREHQQDYGALKARFSNIHAICTVDLADDNHIRLEQIRKVVRDQIGQLPHIGSPLPSTWLQVRITLESNPNNTMLPHEYLAVCMQCGIEDEQSALTLSQYFHDIGVFLHFQDDPILKNIIFLKPNWATNAIYQVLDDSVIFKNKGLLNKQDIINIWQDCELQSHCDEFLQLMEKFHLALKVSSTNQYIVPAKLPSQAPTYPWYKENNLYFRYQYDEFMPRGILFNLMVELEHLIQDHNNVWRRGVLLHKDDAIAEVTETYSSNAIHIRISGDNQRDLLIVIMDMLDKVNRQYHNLKVDKKVPCNCFECNPSQTPYFYLYSEIIKAQQKGRNSIECRQSFEPVNINSLLNAVMPTTDNQPLQPPATRDQIFISYSHQDKAVFDEVKTCFKAEQNLGLESVVWSDTKIKPGEYWFDQIKENLAKAKVAILLISTQFLASKFIKEQELPDIIKAMETEGASIISLVVSPCRVNKHAVLSSIQQVNSPDNALSGLSSHQRAEMMIKLVEAVEQAMDK